MHEAPRPPLRALRALLFSLVTLASLAPSVHAQPRGGRDPSGVELALSGPGSVVQGRPNLFRGTAYRVRGLATLEPYPRVGVHARFFTGEPRRTVGTPLDVVAGAGGRFELPIVAPTAWDEGLGLEITVGDGDEARSFDFPMSGRSAYALIARLDRRLYELGEPVHVWTLVRDARSQRPLAGEVVTVEVENGPLDGQRHQLTTGPDGIASVTMSLPERGMEGHFQVRVLVGGEAQVLWANIGARTYSRLFATLRVEPELAPPGSVVTAIARVTTPSGAPVRDAGVSLNIDRETSASGTTDENGEARIRFTAPTYMPQDTGAIGVTAEIQHGALGAVAASTTLRLAVPLALSMVATSRLGAGLVPEVDDTFYLVVTDGAGEPRPAGLEIEVEGPAVRGGRATVRTDAAGLAEVPARLPAGTWAPGEEGERRTTSVLARIRGPLERTARLDVAVQSDAEVLPIVQSPLATPGSRLEVQLLRRPSAQGRELVVEVFAGGDLLVVRHLGPAEGRLSLDLPPDRLGVLSVRARVVKGDESAEGMGTYDSLLVVPPGPGFVSIAPDRPRYLVGDPARVSVTGGALPQGVRAFAAVMVRDLAAHDGEVPFRAYFLERAFEEAVLAPSAAGAAGARIVRVALAANAAFDAAPAHVPPLLDRLGLSDGESYDGSNVDDTLRDPFPYAREYERRGVADAMRAVEEMLVEALANDALDEITTGTGAARRFEDSLLDDFGGETLGGGVLTVAHLEAADPSFRYETVARRVARGRWIRLSSALARYLDPGDDASVRARMAAREPSERWLPRMVERGLIEASDLRDPWGGQFTIARVASPAFALSHHAAGLELVSPGPDGRAGTSDDVRDPFARAVPEGTPFAVASGEDELLRRLSLLSPYDRTLEALGEAYARITAEMTEELIGDAVHAGVSEGALGLGNIGTIGHGSGTGYGAGGGGFGGRSASAPSIRMGQAAMGAFRGLSRVMRERFPATLLFVPSVELDAAGHATVEVRLADAITTYLVETIVWRTDGWIWSADTRIEVDREIVVDAPIPDVARTDDAIALPVRVSNRGTASRTLVVSVLESDELGIAAAEPRTVEVGPGGAIATPFVVRPTREGHGHVRVAVATPEGDALDAIQLPLEVVRRARRMRVRAELLAVRSGSFTLEVPADATARTGELEVRVGEGLVVPSASGLLQRWAHAMGDPREPDATLESGGDMARRVGARWNEADVNDRQLSNAIDQLTGELDGATAAGAEPAARASAAARILLGLAPAYSAVLPRPIADRLGDLVARARSVVAENAAQLTDDASVLVLAATALAWTSSSEEPDPLAIELVRRAERVAVTLGDEVFVASGTSPLEASALLALADARMGRGARALALVSTLARWTDGGLRLSDEQRTYTRVATARVADREGRARTLAVSVDGVEESRDADGVVRLELPALAAPGSHRVTLTVDAPVLLSARAVATFGAPWPEAPVRGPFAVALEGEVGVLDGTSSLELVIRNTTPRTMSVPVVEIDLPTGAELTERSRAIIASMCARSPDRSGDVLTLTLRPMLPGAERRIPLPLRWSVGGTLLGLGVAAYAAEREDRATVLPPRAITIEAPAAGGAE